MKWNLILQYYLRVPLTLTTIVLLVIFYGNWWIPAKFTIFILMMVTAGLFAVHVLQRQHKKPKEMTLIVSMMIYMVLIVTLDIRDVWIT